LQKRTQASLHILAVPAAAKHGLLQRETILAGIEQSGYDIEPQRRLKKVRDFWQGEIGWFRTLCVHIKNSVLNKNSLCAVCILYEHTVSWIHAWFV
jgi:hypothetical protein